MNVPSARRPGAGVTRFIPRLPLRRRIHGVVRNGWPLLVWGLALCGAAWLYVVDGARGRVTAIVADDRMAVNTQYAARVLSVLVKPGDRVAAGQLVATLDPSDARLRLDVVAADLARLEAEAPAQAERIKGLALIAPAWDMTELMWSNLPTAARKDIEEKGVYLRPSHYGDGPYMITRALIEDGRRHLMLGGLIETGCPVHILQGVQDPDVPWRHAVELVSRFARDDVVLTLIKDGDHRLSRPEDIERLLAAVAEF